MTTSVRRSPFHIALPLRQELGARHKDRRPGRRPEVVSHAQPPVPILGSRGVKEERGVHLLPGAPLHLLFLLLRRCQSGGAALL